jgi:hypothetical protein
MSPSNGLGAPRCFDSGDAQGIVELASPTIPHKSDRSETQGRAATPVLQLRRPPHTAAAAKLAVAALPAPSGREESDAYPVIASLNERWRVIACRNEIQWVMQRRAGQVSGRPRWRGYWHCRTREALIRGAREHAGQIGGDVLVILLRLPERIGGAP